MPVPGASIDLEKTSSDYEDRNTAYFWNRLSFWNYARPPSVILEVGLEPEGLGTVPRAKSWGQELACCREEWSPGQFCFRMHPTGSTIWHSMVGLQPGRVWTYTGETQHCFIWLGRNQGSRQSSGLNSERP